MELRDYLTILRQRWILIATFMLVGVAAAAGVTWTTSPQYASSTALFISTTQSTDDGDPPLQGSLFSLQRVKSYAAMVGQSSVMNRVIDRLDLPETAAQLGSRITAEVQPDTVLLSITVTDESPERAQRIAAATAEVFVGYVGELETPPGRDQATLKATVVDEASFSAAPVSPNAPLNLGFGLVVGLVLGAGAAVLRHTLDTSIRSSASVETLTEAPVIGSIPFDKSAGGAPLLTDIDPYSPRSEAFRVLRTNLQFINPDDDHKVFVVTSALPGEGKSSTTLNLALALVENGNKVAVVEGDLRRPRIAEKLGVVGAVGLTTVLVGRSSLEDALQHTEHDLSILTSGRVPPNPAELLQTDAMSRIIDQLRENHDVVLIDAPPLLPVTDAAIIASKVDGAILVVRHGSTTHDQLSGAIERLAGVDARLIASIVNMTPTSKNRSGYGYGYGYGYAPEDPAPSVAEVAEEAPKRRGRSKAPKTATVLPAPARTEGVDEPDTVDAPQSEADPSTDETETDDVPEVLEALEPPPSDDLVDDDGRGWLDASQGLDDEPARAPRPGRRGGR